MTKQKIPTAAAQSEEGADNKFGRDAVMVPAKIKKGKTRWNQCQGTLNSINPDILKGPVLDFGSGVGYFVLEGLRRDINIWGVDVLSGKIKRYHNLVDFSSSPAYWKNRCLIGDGLRLPFPADHFSVVTSWFVFEHIANTGEVLRELVRVTQPGGIIIIRAQDARCTWEGHCKIPWIPFMSKNLEKVWIKEFGKSPDLREGVYAITQPQVISILETLGCTIVVKDKDLPPMNPLFHKCHTEKQVRDMAKLMKEDLEKGAFVPRQDGLYLYAQLND